jgi:hypothetical protein
MFPAPLGGFGRRSSLPDLGGADDIDPELDGSKPLTPWDNGAATDAADAGVASPKPRKKKETAFRLSPARLSRACSTCSPDLWAEKPPSPKPYHAASTRMGHRKCDGRHGTPFAAGDGMEGLGATNTSVCLVGGSSGQSCSHRLDCECIFRTEKQKSAQVSYFALFPKRAHVSVNADLFFAAVLCIFFLLMLTSEPSGNFARRHHALLTDRHGPPIGRRRHVAAAHACAAATAEVSIAALSFNESQIA